MIFDIHTHIYPDKIAARTTEHGAAVGFPAFCLPSLDGMRAYMDAEGVDGWCMQPVAMRVGSAAGCNRFALACMEAEPRICSFGAIHPASPTWEAELEALAEAGFYGVKLHPQYQHMRIDDPHVVRLVKKAASLRLPVLYHGGWDPAFSGQDVFSSAASAARLLDQVEDEPGLVLIAAHLAGVQTLRDIEELLVGRNIWFDTSLVANALPAEDLRRIVANHGWQHFLFGSDCPWRSPAAEVRYLRSLGLPKEQEAGILGENARRLLGLEE